MKSLPGALVAGYQRYRYARYLHVKRSSQKEPFFTDAQLRAWEKKIPDRGVLTKDEEEEILARDRGEVFVSIIIPSRDHPDDLSRCIDSLCATINPEKERLTYEILVVDNGSEAKNRVKVINILNESKKRRGAEDCNYLYKAEAFHFSRMCNRGADAARGSLLLFLNDDTEALTEGWLSTLVSFALSKGSGAVGAKLVYPFRKGETPVIQHCGIVNAFYGPVHVLKGSPDGEKTFWDYASTVRRVVAVTGACLMIRREVFEEAGRFPEELAVAFNDVDLCYRLHEKGYANLAVNTVRLVHHESLSRGDDTADQAKLSRLSKETAILKERHPRLMTTDPYFDPRLSSSDVIAPFFAGPGPDPRTMDSRTGKLVSLKKEGYRKDPCVYVNMEYAGSLKESGTVLADDTGDYFLCGFSFVAGSDNALYRRFLILQRMEERDGRMVRADKETLSFQMTDTYRPDKAALFSDQVRTELGGFRVRIAKHALKPGRYRVGICVHKRMTRQRLVNFSEMMLDADT